MRSHDFKNMPFNSFLAVVFIFSCMTGCSSKALKPVPEFKTAKCVLARQDAIRDSRGFPAAITRNFYTTDSGIVSYVEFENIVGSHEIRWEWYRPDGNLYYASEPAHIQPNEGKYIAEGVTRHQLLINGEPAENFPGNWHVKIFLDTRLIATESFRLLNGPDEPQRKGFAVIIGISEYLYSDENMGNLPFADKDAIDFKNKLIELGWDKNYIRCIVNKEATKREIGIALESWLTKAKSSDLILLYWSGHGFPDPADPEKIYFACYDTDPAIPATGYRMDQVRMNLEERKTKNVIVFADTCHAGKLITRGTGNSRAIVLVPAIEKMRRKNEIPDGWIFMVGSDTDREAIEHSSWTNGAFTHCLLKALSGDADGYESAGKKDSIVTMGESRAYLYSKMPEETLRVLGTSLHPVIATSSGDPDIWNLNLQMK